MTINYNGDWRKTFLFRDREGVELKSLMGRKRSNIIIIIIKIIKILI